MKRWARKSNKQRANKIKSEKKRTAIQDAYTRTNARTTRNKTPYGRIDIRKKNGQQQQKTSKSPKQFFLLLFLHCVQPYGPSIVARMQKKQRILCRALFSSVHWIFVLSFKQYAEQEPSGFCCCSSVVEKKLNIFLGAFHQPCANVSNCRRFEIDCVLAGRRRNDTPQIKLKSVLAATFLFRNVFATLAVTTNE